MILNEHDRICPNCGGTMKKQRDGNFVCESCGKELSEDALEGGSESRL